MYPNEIKSGDKVIYNSYGKDYIATVTRLSSSGGVVFLNNGRWMHKISVKKVI